MAFLFRCSWYLRALDYPSLELSPRLRLKLGSLTAAPILAGRQSLSSATVSSSSACSARRSAAVPRHEKCMCAIRWRSAMISSSWAEATWPLTFKRQFISAAVASAECTTGIPSRYPKSTARGFRGRGMHEMLTSSQMTIHACALLACQSVMVCNLSGTSRLTSEHPSTLPLRSQTNGDLYLVYPPMRNTLCVEFSAPSSQGCAGLAGGMPLTSGLTLVCNGELAYNSTPSSEGMPFRPCVC
mmetsp:Transcript_38953/g.78067  ORF Transcript_38953/g.78067 Transcript_38953/m.78067 type:complete len:242 (+) Transcript_38953:156-881(+)